MLDPPDDRSLLLLAEGSHVVAMRRHDGHVTWRTTLPGVHRALTLHRGRVFATTSDRIVVLDYASGVIVAELALPPGARRATFLVDDEHLYVVGGDEVVCTSLDGHAVWRSPHGLPLAGEPTLALPGNVRHGDESRGA